MKNIIKTVLLSGLVMYSQVSFSESCAQGGITLNGWVGLDSSSGTIYATLSSSNNKCPCNEVRFTEKNTDAKAALSILIAAKLADRKVRIDFLDKENCNSGYRAYIQ